MRLDKFLKVSRIIKRRTLSKEISQSERVKVNGKVAKRKPCQGIHQCKSRRRNRNSVWTEIRKSACYGYSGYDQKRTGERSV